jgi:hypothetical protein
MLAVVVPGFVGSGRSDRAEPFAGCVAGLLRVPHGREWSAARVVASAGHIYNIQNGQLLGEFGVSHRYQRLTANGPAPAS